MIQRIQTLFLLAAVTVSILILFMPLAEILTDGGEILVCRIRGVYDADGVSVMPSLSLLILSFAVAHLLGLGIFLFKKRKLQIRFCVYVIILSFGQIGMILYYWSAIRKELPVDSYYLKLPVVFPFLIIILTYLAFRGIRKDEILIRSMDKLR